MTDFSFRPDVVKGAVLANEAYKANAASNDEKISEAGLRKPST